MREKQYTNIHERKPTWYLFRRWIILVNSFSCKALFYFYFVGKHFQAKCDCYLTSAGPHQTSPDCERIYSHEGRGLLWRYSCTTPLSNGPCSSSCQVCECNRRGVHAWDTQNCLRGFVPEMIVMIGRWPSAGVDSNQEMTDTSEEVSLKRSMKEIWTFVT